MSNNIIKRRRSTRYQLQEQLTVIRELQQEGKTNREISEILDIPLQRVERYSNKIYESSKELWKLKERDSLEARALEIEEEYMDFADVCKTIRDDPTKSPKDRIEAGVKRIECFNFAYIMYDQGPLRVKRLTNKNFNVSNDSN